MSAATPFSDPPPNPFQPPGAPSTARGRSVLWWVAGGALVSMCCCGSFCLIPMGGAVYQAATERDDVEQVVTEFLADLDAKRFDSCLSRFSARSVRVASLTRESMEKLAEQPDFRGCQTAHVTNINVTYTVNSNQDLPQGTVANVSGTVTYSDGATGTVTAVLEKEKGAWRLHQLTVNRPATPNPEP
jgi:hypothetical protein